MATYFHESSEIQAPDGLQTLVLMNPSFVQYSADAQPAAGGSSLVFLNSATTAAPTGHLAHMLPPPQQTQQFVGIPLSVSATTASQDHQSPVPAMPEVYPLHGLIPRPQHSLWRPVEPSTQARETPRGSWSQQGGLSLSLSSLQPPGFGSLHREREPARPAASGGGGGSCSGSPSSTSGVTRNGGALGIQGVLLSSKYLKAVQELLDEAVHVESGIDKADTSKKAGSSGESKAAGESSSSVPAAAWKEENSGKGCVTELSTAERQEIQMKKAKLINMIDEVEHRYRQYHRQMQIVISSFELAAGASSAKTYTALALQTILKQFRCLKDAIAGQIKAANKSLGEEEDSPRGKLEGSRLKFVDHQFRQQRALQQLGMIQNHPWRPQRGLPERAVSILRAWLFEHFLHPYPKDSDKLMLAEQTGLTRSQVSNWFINARVRLWKPMVEEMYSEETKEHEKNGIDEKTGSKIIVPDEDTASKSSSPQDKGPSSENISNKSFKSKETNSMSQDALAISTNSASSIGGNLSALPGFAPVRTLELEGIAQVTKKPRSTEVLHSPNNVLSLEDQLTMKFGDERAQGRDGYSVMGGPMNFIGGFGQCPIEEIGRFGADQFVPSPTFAGNAVSLTLGLPHTENLLLSIDHHQAFLPSQNIHFGRRVKVGGEGNEFRVVDNPITAPPHSFHCI